MVNCYNWNSCSCQKAIVCTAALAGVAILGFVLVALGIIAAVIAVLLLGVKGILVIDVVCGVVWAVKNKY